MTKVISEREELEELQKENIAMMQQIIQLQKEIIDMEKMIEELQPILSNSEPQVVPDSNDNKIVV